MGIKAGFRARARWHGDGGFSEVIVEVFKPRTPVRSNRDFGPGAQYPATAHAKGFVFITGEVRSLNETGLRPGKATSSVDQEIVEGVADAAAQPCDIVDFFGEVSVRCDP